MKKSCLQFIKSNGSDLLVPLHFLLAGALLPACSNHKVINKSSEEVGAPGLTDGKSSSKLISVVDAAKERWIQIRTVATPQTVSPLQINAKSCIEQKFSFRSTLEVLGVGYDMVFEEDGGNLALAVVEDSETKITGVALPPDIRTEACQAMEDVRRDSILLREDVLMPMIGVIKNVVSSLTPDCKSVQVDGHRFKCVLDSLLPQPALVKTEDFQRAMIRKWSRQPYILARRTGVVATLAKTAIYSSKRDGFDKFCKILQFSLPEELPVVMTSKRWQTALCSGRPDLQRQASLYGLAKGTQELAMLRELYEGVSRVGLLSIKIPEDVIPGRVPESSRQPLRITISPDQEVSRRLVDEAKKYLGRPDRDEKPKRLVARNHRRRGQQTVVAAPVEVLQAKAPERSDMCWHPVFGESWGLLRIADGMKLTGNGFNSDCGFIYEHEDGLEREMASLSKYLLQSLSSETEFVLDNGQSKLLRLPHGKYTYKVHVLPPNPLDLEEVDEEGTPTSSGEIAWGDAKNLSIRQW